MTRTVLVINSGSSSIKYQLIDVDSETSLAAGVVERIGEETGSLKHETSAGEVALEQPFPDHTAGLRAVLATFRMNGPDLAEAGLVAVGHRVVQGGERFDAPTIITPKVEADIEELSALAPLHNPPNLDGIRAAREAFPELPHVAVFDTAFHRTLSPAAYTYAIPTEVAAKNNVRRYGFHGTSHKYVSHKVAEIINRPVAELNTIVLHLGNGASVTAVRGGKSVETSMGLTPLEGLVMGTRSGDIDPAALLHLSRVAGMSIDDLDTMLNKKSGLLGLAGSNDMRDVRRLAAEGDERAQLALDVWAHRVRGYVGQYLAQLGNLDVIVFTAGVGENSAPSRADALAGLENLGIIVDPKLNDNAPRGQAARISPDGAPVQVWIVPTNEELEIAREAAEIVG